MPDPELPLLRFEPAKQRAERDDLPQPGGFPKTPGGRRQGERLAPKFQSLEKHLEAGRIQAVGDASDFDPDLVLVLETAGTIDQFANATRHLTGLQLLDELELDDIGATDDFYVPNTKKEDGRNPSIKRKLYVVLTNLVAVEQLLSLWRQFVADDRVVFPTGLAPLKAVYQHLLDVRRWELRDRIDEGSSAEHWKEQFDPESNNTVRVEIELWSRDSNDQADAAQQRVVEAIEKADGELVTTSRISEIAYHCLVAHLPQSSLRTLLNDQTGPLATINAIRSFRVFAQSVIDTPDDEDGNTTSDVTAAYPMGDAIAAVFDGLPVENHALLRDRLTIDDPEDYASEIEVRDRVHGTGMCSLVVWGDLGNSREPLQRPVYTRPILKPVPSLNRPFNEATPTDQTLVDLIHQAVRRLFENTNEHSAQAPEVKIINLSIGDEHRPFVREMSPLARLLDWLSSKYNVLFVVSGGNQRAAIDVGMTEVQFSRLSPEAQQQRIHEAVEGDQWSRQMFSPSEAINVLTVGTTHDDAFEQHASIGRLIEPVARGMPNPISPKGTGFKRSPKPEVVEAGGRLNYDYDFNSSGTLLVPRPTTRPPGCEAAAPSPTQGVLDRTTHTSGTSNAAALTTHKLARGYESLETLFADDFPTVIPFTPALLKALAVHSCSWDSIEDVAGTLYGQWGKADARQKVSRSAGYGVVARQGGFACLPTRATLIGFGTLRPETSANFEFPIPLCMAAETVWRRITVTLAWITPVDCIHRRYRGVRLWTSPVDNSRNCKRSHCDWRAVKNGTLQHEHWEGTSAWTVPEDDALSINVNAASDVPRCKDEVRYGIAVSLEARAETNLPIYDQVQQLIEQRAASRVDVSTRLRS